MGVLYDAWLDLPERERQVLREACWWLVAAWCWLVVTGIGVYWTARLAFWPWGIPVLAATIVWFVAGGVFLYGAFQSIGVD